MSGNATLPLAAKVHTHAHCIDFVPHGVLVASSFVSALLSLLMLNATFGATWSFSHSALRTMFSSMERRAIALQYLVAMPFFELFVVWGPHIDVGIDHNSTSSVVAWLVVNTLCVGFLFVATFSLHRYRALVYRAQSARMPLAIVYFCDRSINFTVGVEGVFIGFVFGCAMFEMSQVDDYFRDGTASLISNYRISADGLSDDIAMIPVDNVPGQQDVRPVGTANAASRLDVERGRRASKMRRVRRTSLAPVSSQEESLVFNTEIDDTDDDGSIHDGFGGGIPCRSPPPPPLPLRDSQVLAAREARLVDDGFDSDVPPQVRARLMARRKDMDMTDQMRKMLNSGAKDEDQLRMMAMTFRDRLTSDSGHSGSSMITPRNASTSGTPNDGSEIDSGF